MNAATARKIDDIAINTYTRTLRQLNAPVEHYVDEKGRKVRKPNLDCPVTYEEVQDFLRGQRAIDEDEALEAIGVNALKSLLKSGKIKPVKDCKSAFWITEAGAEYYRLTKVMGCDWPK